jgi:hypothetical protein
MSPWALTAKFITEKNTVHFSNIPIHCHSTSCRWPYCHLRSFQQPADGLVVWGYANGITGLTLDDIRMVPLVPSLIKLNCPKLLGRYLKLWGRDFTCLRWPFSQPRNAQGSNSVMINTKVAHRQTHKYGSINTNGPIQEIGCAFGTFFWAYMPTLSSPQQNVLLSHLGMSSGTESKIARPKKN